MNLDLFPPPMTCATPQSRRNLVTARKLVASYALGDEQGLAAFCEPDAIVHLPGDPGILPWAGRWSGRDFPGAVRAVKNSVDLLEFVAHTIEAAGERVLVHVSERARVRATGKCFVNELVGVMTFGDAGRVTHYIEYADTAAMHAAFA